MFWMLLFIGSTATIAHASPRFVIINRDLTHESVRLVGIDGERIYYLPDAPGARVESRSLDEAIALLSPPFAVGMEHNSIPPALGGVRRPNVGLLQLADGQRFPGQAPFRSRAETDELHWHHPWLGSMAVPLDSIQWVIFRGGAMIATPPVAGEADVVLLANGDTLEGFIQHIADPLLLEIDTDGRPPTTRTIEIPLNRIAVVSMVAAPASQAAVVPGARFWLTDGTILNVDELMIGEDGYARIRTRWSMDEESSRIASTEIAGVLIERGRMVPLAMIEPRRINGPPTRYEIPRPRVHDDPTGTVLDLASIEYRGPLTVEYDLPRGASRFAATAVLPVGARQWGDYELVIRSGSAEVLRQRMNADEPELDINIALHGSDLAIELTEGAHGPIQDHLVLLRAMVMVEPN